MTNERAIRIIRGFFASKDDEYVNTEEFALAMNVALKALREKIEEAKMEAEQ